MMFPDIRIIDEIGINERTIVSWFDRADQTFGFGIFHISEQPNVQAKLSAYTNWGYLVYNAPKIKDPTEAAEVYDLYLKDIIAGNYWFENDKYFIIPEELQHLMEDTQKSLDSLDKKDHTRPKLVLIKNDE